MGGSLVDRATNDELIGPDWAINAEICNLINRNHGQARDVVKGLKKCLASKIPKVQLLALALLETVMKNCGDIIRMQVTEQYILHEMVKIVKKKNPDLHVKEKILTLIDTWQEAFGGSRARYPQFYSAYQELSRLGVVFPQRSERSAPIFTAQMQPLTSYPPNLKNAGDGEDFRESSTASGFLTLSLTQIHNARGILDVLAEILNALDPENREGLKQEVVVDLVDQCRSYKQRVVQLVNSTSSEGLLAQGLALNDDLQRVLARHDAIAARIAVRTEKLKSIQQVLVDIEDSELPTKDRSSQPHRRSSPSTSNPSPFEQLAVPAPPESNGSTTPPTKSDPHMDLLSGENFNAPATESPLALLPISDPIAASAPDQNILSLVDVFPQNNSKNSNSNPSSPFGSIAAYPVSQGHPTAPPQLQLQLQQPAIYSNLGVPSITTSQFEQANYVQGTEMYQANPNWSSQQQPLDYLYMNAQDGVLSPPPWESEPVQSNQHPTPQLLQPSQIGGINTPTMQNGKLASINPSVIQNGSTGGFHPQPSSQGTQIGGMFPQFKGIYLPPIQQGIYPQTLYEGPFVVIPQQPMHGIQMSGYNQMRQSYSYPNLKDLSQRMYGLSMQDDGYSNASSLSYSLQLKEAQKPEDKLFGDLVSMAKSKTNKTQQQ